MNPLKYERGCWPTRQQELLLRAALLPGKNAIEAWEEWKSSVDIDQIDPGSHRLLPLLYRNLHIHEVKDPLMEKFKGVYRLTWYKNQMAFQNMATLLRSFHEAGIQTMILKGAALTQVHYRDYGLRPMVDFDILVHTEQSLAAINLLMKSGWLPERKWPGKFMEPSIHFRHDNGFKDIAGREFSLHRYVLREGYQANADDDFWDGAVSTKIHDVSTCALNPTDQLLHVCVHGEEWNYVTPFDFLADAMIIMNTSKSEIEWNRLITQTQKRRLILPFKDTLNYLKDTLEAPVPLTALQSLQNMHTSKIERIVYEVKTKIRQPTLLNVFLVHWSHYSQSMGDTRLQHKFIGFPKYIKQVWGVEHLWQVPFYIIISIHS